jgi:hypothetical protein
MSISTVRAARRRISATDGRVAVLPSAVIAAILAAVVLGALAVTAIGLTGSSDVPLQDRHLRDSANSDVASEKRPMGGNEPDENERGDAGATSGENEPDEHEPNEGGGRNDPESVAALGSRRTSLFSGSRSSSSGWL